MNERRKHTARSRGRAAGTLLAATVLALVPALTAGPAYAGAEGEQSNGTYSLAVNVTNVTPGGGGINIPGGSISVSVPPKCWWSPFNLDNLAYYNISPNDPQAMEKFFEELTEDTTITFVASRLGHPAPGYVASHPITEFNWYALRSAPGVNCADEGFTSSGGQGPPDWWPGSGQAPVAYAAFAASSPPPLVEVEDVVEEVWDAVTAQIEAPDLDRNPRISGVGGATLVNLPTWFWVDNVQGALAGNGRIELEVSIPGSPVRATLSASTDGVQITSPVGSVECSLDQAVTAWSPGASEGSACTLPFERAQTNGWPVSAQTVWTGSWEGQDNDGAAGGELDALTSSSTVAVPVVESQALVTRVD